MHSPIFQFAADLYREMRQEFEVSLEAAYAAAEAATNGCLLTAAGRAEPIDPYSLLTGPWSRVERWASPELIEHFQLKGRPSVAAFEREWFAAWLGAADDADSELPMHVDHTRTNPTTGCQAAWSGMGGFAHECNLPNGHGSYHLCRCAATDYGVL